MLKKIPTKFSREHIVPFKFNKKQLKIQTFSYAGDLKTFYNDNIKFFQKVSLYQINIVQRKIFFVMLQEKPPKIIVASEIEISNENYELYCN